LQTLLEEMTKNKDYPIQKIRKVEYKMNYGIVSVVVTFGLN
jgi:hypothetical protein